MPAKHADEPRVLTDPWVGASKTAMAFRAFVLAPANIPAADRR
jgi:L-ascorbate metabolism protein UlaG (beta-lactamase superfamily)